MTYTGCMIEIIIGCPICDCFVVLGVVTALLCCCLCVRMLSELCLLIFKWMSTVKFVLYCSLTTSDFIDHLTTIANLSLDEFIVI